MFQMYWLVFLLLIATNVVAKKLEIQSTAWTGAYFKPAPADIVLYQTSLPLQYVYPWTENNLTFGLTNVTSDSSKFIIHGQQLIFKQLQKINYVVENVCTRNGTKLNRHKRGLQPLGDLLEWCCNVATKQTIETIGGDSKLAEIQIQQLKENVLSQQKYLTDFAQQSRRREQQENLVIQEIRQHNDLLVDAANNLSTRLKDETILEIQQNTLMVELVNKLEKIMVMQSCRNKLIPAGVIPPTQFQEDLQILERQLHQEKMVLAVPSQEIYKYYTLQIVSCVLSGTSILIFVKIPLKEANTEIKLFELLTIPFQYHAQLCQVLNIPQVVVSRDGRISSLMGPALKNCNIGTSELCYLPRFPSNKLADDCLQRLYEGATVAEINKYCTLQCRTDEAAVITRVDGNNFVLSGVSPNTSYRCAGDKADQELLFPHPLGAYHIHLPCHCNMTIGRQQLAQQFPCLELYKGQFAVKHLLPSFWLTAVHAEVVLTPESGQLQFFSGNMVHLYNPDWTSTIDVLNLTPPVLQSITPQLDKIITRHWLLQTNVSIGFYWSVLLTFVLCYILYKNPYLLVIIMHIKMVSALPVVDHDLIIHLSLFVFGLGFAIFMIIIITLIFFFNLRRSRAQPQQDQGASAQ